MDSSMNAMKRAADLLQNSAEEFESPDGLSVCVGIDAWNEFFEALDSELERAQAEPVNQQMLAEAVALLEKHQKWLNKLPVPTAGATYQMMNVVGKAIDTLAGMAEENHQAEPVAGQCKFSCESKWLPCSVEHHYHVLSCPDEWPGYETRLLYVAPQPSSPPGWKLVPVEPTSKMIVAGAEADPQFFTHAQFVYRAMLAAAPEQEGGAA